MTSMLTMSPSASGRLSGMPWQMTSLTDVQTDFGKPAVVERARVAAELEGLLVDDRVEAVGGDAGLDERADVQEDVGRGGRRPCACAR